MRRTDMDSAIRRVRDVRLALAGLLVLSMTANLMLTMSFAGRETVTVLVPASAGPAWEVGGNGVGINRAGGRYLEDMGAHRGGDAADAHPGRTRAMCGSRRRG